MNGLFVWAHSLCRSTLAFYSGLGKAFSVPLKIVVFKGSSDLREELGFSNAEFEELDISFLKDVTDIGGLIKEYRSYHHLFGCYHLDKAGEIMRQVKQEGGRVAIMSEAPCNMDKGVRRLMKGIYIQYILPYKLRERIRLADFIINLSDKDTSLLQLGWQRAQVIPCGYYPPPIPDSRKIQRGKANWQHFHILLSGKHTYHRSPMVLLKALYWLKRKGIACECTITQDGPLKAKMKSFIKRHQLHNVRFIGFQPMEEMVKLYESCSVYVGTGNDEPWGIRLNDALNCGAPLVVSEGMGGSKWVKDYGCGLTFPRGKYKELASCLERLVTDKELYLSIAEKAFGASEKIDPYKKAVGIADEIAVRYPQWAD